MSAFLFGVCRAEPTKKEFIALTQIARAHGCRFIAIHDPYQCWFSGPGKGDPFDFLLRRSVLAAVAAAGIAYETVGRK